MRVIVTGGCGFIGSHLVDELLNNDHEVLVIDNLSTGFLENLNRRAEFIQADVRDNSIGNVFSEFKPEIVYHHAAQIDVQRSIMAPEYDADININGTINLLNHCVKYGVNKIIYASSAAVYGNPTDLPINENCLIAPISYYGISKYTPENYIKVFSSLYQLKYTILRYANVYGKRQGTNGEAGVVSIFTDKFLKGDVPIIYGDGKQSRDFIYVKDIIEANLLVMNKGDNQIYNVSSNRPIKIEELFYYISRIFNRSVQPVYCSPRQGDIEHSYLDNSKISSQLGWKPRYQLIEGLTEMNSDVEITKIKI